MPVCLSAHMCVCVCMCVTLRLYFPFALDKVACDLLQTFYDRDTHGHFGVYFRKIIIVFLVSVQS